MGGINFHNGIVKRTEAKLAKVGLMTTLLMREGSIHIQKRNKSVDTLQQRGTMGANVQLGPSKDEASYKPQGQTTI